MNHNHESSETLGVNPEDISSQRLLKFQASVVERLKLLEAVEL